MDIFGIGPLELFFIILLAIIIFGPKDIQKAGKTAGTALRKLVQSDTWKTVTQASRKIKTLPNDLMREAGVDELKKTIAPLQSDLKKIQAASRKPASSLLGESWIAEPEAPDRQSPVGGPPPPNEHPEKPTE